MKKLVISGSCKLQTQVKYWCEYFKNHGYTILDYPKPHKPDLFSVCEIYTTFYRNIDAADEMFVMNEDKDGIEGYIGPSTFSEIVYAVIQNQNCNKQIAITLLKMPSKSSNVYNEIKEFIDKKLIKLFKFELSKELNVYTPFDEQEQKDKELLFNYLNLHLKLSSHPIDLLLTRENTLLHFSATGFVVNKKRDKVLLVHHNILGGWIYPGGHADGEENLLSVAIREVEEETGIEAKALDISIFSIQALPILGHYKRGQYVSAHTHFDVIYLLEADDNEPLKIKPDENSNVKWAPLDDTTYSNMIDFIKPIHLKLVEKLKIHS